MSAIFENDLERLKDEIRQYEREEDLWLISAGISNSGGNLALHICGNLQHFIGTVLGKSGYVRNRPEEFAAKGVPRLAILEEIETTKASIIASVNTLNPSDLELAYPVQNTFGPSGMNTMQALVILAAHLNYHLGQINYHRRLLTSL